MREYKCDYSVNGVRTREIVTAYSSSEAKKIIEARNSGAKISWISVVPA